MVGAACRLTVPDGLVRTKRGIVHRIPWTTTVFFSSLATRQGRPRRGRIETPTGPSMLAAGTVNMGFAGHHAAVQVMAMVVLVVIDREAACVLAEQLDESRIGADLLRMA